MISFKSGSSMTVFLDWKPSYINSQNRGHGLVYICQGVTVHHWKKKKFLVWSVYRFDQPSTSINWKSQKIRELTEVLDGVAEVTSEGPQGAVGRGDGRMPSMDLMKKVIKRPPDQKGVPKWSISRGVDVRFKYYYYYTIGVSERACSGRDTRLRPTIT